MRKTRLLKFDKLKLAACCFWKSFNKGSTNKFHREDWSSKFKRLNFLLIAISLIVTNFLSKAISFCNFRF